MMSTMKILRVFILSVGLLTLVSACGGGGGGGDNPPADGGGQPGGVGDLPEKVYCPRV